MNVDEDDRDGAAGEGCTSFGPRRQRHDEESVGTLGVGECRQVVVALLDRLNVIDDQVELAVGEDRVDTTQPLSRLGPRKEGHDDANRQRAPETQSTRCRAGGEAQFVHHRQDSLAGLGVDAVLAVQGPGGGRDAYSGMPGDIANGDGLPRHSVLRGVKPVS
jgi:hypothetical protein